MVDILNPKTWDRKTFLIVALGGWILYGFLQPSNISVQATYQGNLTEYFSEEGTNVAVGFLEAIFAGFTEIIDYLKEHALYFVIGLGLFIASFIFYKK